MTQQSLQVHVTPKAGKDEIVGWSTEARDELKVRVCAIPDKGAANAAVIKLLAKSLGVAKSDIAIALGHSSRKKLLKLEMDEDGFEVWRQGLPVCAA